MRKFIATLFGAVGASAATTAAAAPPPAHEASMNFDMENVKPFLERINSKLSLGLDSDKLTKFTMETEFDQERSLHLIVKFQGKPVRLEYGVFMDDIDAPDLSFFSDSPQLAELIQSELEVFAEELGI
jgi:hypothetical protein